MIIPREFVNGPKRGHEQRNAGVALHSLKNRCTVENQRRDIDVALLQSQQVVDIRHAHVLLIEMLRDALHAAESGELFLREVQADSFCT